VADENPRKRRRLSGGLYSERMSAVDADEITQKISRENDRVQKETEVLVTDPLAIRRRNEGFQDFVQTAPPQPLKSVVAYRSERGWRNAIERYVEQLRKLNKLKSAAEVKDFYNPITKHLNGLKYSEFAIERYVQVPMLHINKMIRAYDALQNGYLMPWTFMNFCFKNATWKVRPDHLNLVSLIDVAPDDWEKYLPLFPKESYFSPLHLYTPRRLAWLNARGRQASAFAKVIRRYQELEANKMPNVFGPKRSLTWSDHHMWTATVRQTGLGPYYQYMPGQHVGGVRIDTESEVLDLIYRGKNLKEIAEQANLPWSTHSDNGMPQLYDHGV